MNSYEFYQKYPEVAQEWQDYNNANKKKVSSEEFLRLKFSRNPTDTRVNELDPGLMQDTSKGNTFSSQQGTQEGAFSTGGTTNQTQTQTQSGKQEVIDTLGFGDLLKGQVGSAQAADAERNAFLTDLVKTGGSGFQDQVSQAANYALSGPGMQGTGNAAKGRVAGSAVADVARNNANLRLNAAQQLSGPTAVTSLVAAGNPYLGQTSESTGISDMVTNETASGTSSGSSQTSGFGQQPVQKGGCYVSSMFALRGQIGKRVIRRCVKYKLSQRRFRYMLWGYSVYGHNFARYVEGSKVLGGLMKPVCRAILYQELRWSGKKLPWKLWPATAHAIFHYGSAAIGFLSGRRKVTTVISDFSKKLDQAGLLFPENF